MTCSRAPTIDRNVLFSYKTGLKISKKGSFFGTGRNGRSARRGIVRGNVRCFRPARRCERVQNNFSRQISSQFIVFI